MTGITGHGPWPGTDVLEAQHVVVGDLTSTPSEVTGIPFAVQLAARGPAADATGATAALLVDLPVELGAHGWKLADSPGRDGARAQALLREDLDALAVAAYGYAGPLVVPMTGPLTLAASLYLARGDLVLSDRGAVAELADSLASGVAERLAAVRRAIPGAVVTLLVHEPLLARVLAGAVASFSGYSALRSVPGPVAGERLGALVRAAKQSGAERVVVRSGGRGTLATMVAGHVDGIVVVLDAVDEGAWERVAEAHERGTQVWAELPVVVPSEASARSATQDVVDRSAALVGPWRRVGLPLAGLRDVVLLPPAPAPQATPAEARAAIAGAVQVAQVVAERAEG